MPTKVSSREGGLAIKVRLKDELIEFGDTAPIMVGQRVMVPLRGIFERMEATVEWKPDVREVHALRGETRIVLPIGRNEAKVGEQTVQLDQPAMIIDKRTVVPLRFLATALGAEVEWQTADRTVAITAPAR